MGSAFDDQDLFSYGILSGRRSQLRVLFGMKSASSLNESTRRSMAGKVLKSKIPPQSQVADDK
jgi:hypothetical protein